MLFVLRVKNKYSCKEKGSNTPSLAYAMAYAKNNK